MNHTWKGNSKLKPFVRYHLAGGEKLKLGSVSAMFQIHSTTIEDNTEHTTFLGEEKSKQFSRKRTPKFDS